MEFQPAVTAPISGRVRADLAARLRGQVIGPGDEGYETARLVDNAAVDGRPALIVRAADTLDVVTTIGVARDSGVPLAVRAGGHSVAGHSSGDGVIVLDLSAMRAVEIDGTHRIAWAEAGVLVAAYTRAAYEAGFATPFGDTGSVGVAGLTLAGGIGWLVRKHGLTIDSLLSVDLVTADGRQLRASSDEHPDLFWAVRGGGGNFGVVTRFQFQLHPIGTVYAGSVVFPATREVLRGLVPLALAAPDELTVMPSIMAAPPIPSIPDALHGRLVVFLDVLYAGPSEDGRRALAPLRALATPIDDSVETKPYPAVFPERSGVREGYAARALFLDGLDDETIDIIERHLSHPSTLEALAHLRILGGAMARVPTDATAFGWRDRTTLLWIITPFTDMTEAARHEAWTKAFWSDLRHKGSGTYVNFMGDEGDEGVRAAYPASTYARLAEIKRRYDPDNLFRRNHNIEPAPAPADMSA